MDAIAIRVRAETLRVGDEIVTAFKRDNVTPLRTEKVREVEHAPQHCHKWRNHLHVNRNGCYFHAAMVYVLSPRPHA